MEDIESYFGRTPISTPFGSQDSSLSCAIDISDEEDDGEDPDININGRVLQFIQDGDGADADVEDLSDQEDGRNGDSGNGDPTASHNSQEMLDLDYDENLMKVRSLKRDGCKCKMNCPSKFTETDMINHIQNVLEMEKNDKDMYIMGTLMDFDKEKTTKGKKRKRNRKKFMFFGQCVCRTFFMVVFAIGRRQLKNLIQHMDKNGPVVRTHGNTGKKSPHCLVFEDIRAAVQFIVNYGHVHGLPQPAAPRGTDNAPPIYLHCEKTKKSIHKEYVDSLSENARCIQYSTFTKIWRSCVPHVRIATPKDDVCATCEKLRKKILDARDEEDKLSSTTEMRDHVLAAQNERELYNLCIERAREGNVDGSNYFHITFDYCQNVTLPHHGRQMGPIYFTTPRKVQIFGIRLDGIPRQLNFLIDEHETIGMDGTLTHGPNAVISMIDWALAEYGNGEPSCALHADNCPGQNKNQYVVGYFMWRVMTGRNQSIEYMMQVPGHARCHIDGGFGLLKQLYRRSDCDSINQLEDVVNKSSEVNQAVRYPSWQWRDWKSLLQRTFRSIKGIRKYQYFKFSSETPGMVSMRKERGGELTNYDIRRADVETVEDVMPDILIPPGLSPDRQAYLYRVVRPFVRPEYQNLTCPPRTTQ